MKTELADYLNAETAKLKSEQKQTGPTPGPWTHHTTATPEWARQYKVYPEQGNHDIALIYDGEQAQANAVLIAASPMLLEACITAFQYLEPTHAKGHPVMWALGQAIDMARCDPHA